MAQMIVTKTRPAYQAYQLLCLGFIAGLLPFSANTFRLSQEFAEGAA